MSSGSLRPAIRCGGGIAVLLAVLLIGWGPLLAGRCVLFYGDIALYFVPLLDAQRHELLVGRIPLWDPWTLCGKPLLGNPQAWPFYPSTLLLFLLPAERATGVIGSLHLFWAAWGTLLFLQRRGLTTSAALVGAIGWGFGGALVSKMQFPNMVQAASFLPWILWGIEGVIASRSAKSAALLALLIGLALLAAHPQMFLMTFYIGAAWAIYRIRKIAPNERMHCILLFAGAFACGVLLAMVQLLPTIELARVSVRPDLTLDKANRFVLPAYSLLYNFIAPNFYGNPATETVYSGRGNFWEPCAYAGILPFALSVGATGWLWKLQTDVRFWAVAVCVCVWLSLGRDGGLYALAFHILPGLSRFHDAARWLIPGTFALACLAAHGAEALLASCRNRPRRAACAAVLLCLCAADLLWFDHTLNPVAPPAVFANARLPLGEGGRVFHVDEGRVWGRYISYRTYATVDGPKGQNFVASRGPNLPALARQGQAGGYEPVARTNSAALASALRDRTRAGHRGKSRETLSLLRASGVTTLIYESPTPDASPRFAVDGAAPGRAQWWTHWTAAPTPPDALVQMLLPSWNGVPVVAGDTVPAVTNDGSPSGARIPAKIEELTPQKIIVTLPAPHKGGLLVLADTLHPGWRATVNGIPVPIHSVNGVFRGVFASRGAKKVVFCYEPDSGRVGMFLSLAAAGILSALFAANGYGRKRFIPGV